jgi:hypothetical protein
MRFLLRYNSMDLCFFLRLAMCFLFGSISIDGGARFGYFRLYDMDCIRFDTARFGNRGGVLITLMLLDFAR